MPGSPSALQFFSDLTEPGVAQKAGAVLAAEPPRPEIDPTPKDVVELPGGLPYNGQVITIARVRELTGDDEEELARAATAEGLISALLTRGVVTLGGVPSTSRMLDDLLVGDRDALVIGIRRACFGDTVDFEKFTCSGCSSQFSVSVDLDDIPTVHATAPGEMKISVDLRGGRKAQVRLATGHDQKALLEAGRTGKPTGAEQDTLLLSRTVLSIAEADGTEHDVGHRKDAVRALSISDRRAIMRASQQRRPGPRMDEVTITCPDCQTKVEVPISIDTLFRD